MTVAVAPSVPSTAHRDALLAAIIAFVLTIMVTAIGSLLKLPEGVVAGLAGVGGVVPPVITLIRFQRAMPRKADLAALSRGRIERPHLPVVIIIGIVLFAVESAVGGLFGFTVDIARAWMGGTDQQVLAAAGEANLWFGVPVILVIVYLILGRASHYLGSRPFGWLALAVGVYLLFRIIVTVLFLTLTAYGTFYDVATTLMGNVVMALLFLVVALVASLVQRRRHSEFVVSRLFRKLAPQDKHAVQEMLREIVDVTPTAPVATAAAVAEPVV